MHPTPQMHVDTPPRPVFHSVLKKSNGSNSLNPLSCLVEVSPTRMVYSGPECNRLPEYPNTKLPEWNVSSEYLAHEGNTVMSVVSSGIPCWRCLVDQRFLPD